MLSRIFGLRSEGRGGWRKLYNEEFHQILFG
jgi:hypothetical protein